MDRLQPQPQPGSPALLFEERVCGWVRSSDMASKPCIELPETGRNSASADVHMTSLLPFQYHLSPVTNRQPIAKDAFLIILRSLNAAVTSGCEDTCKTFLLRQIKAKKLFRKEPKPLKLILKEYWKYMYHLLLLTIESVPLQHKLNLFPG